MSSSKIRNYLPGIDHAAVVEICKDVYGGFDALPKVINSYVDQPDTYIPVIVDEEDTLQAIILYQLRGGVFYIWGARTRAIHQGKGMGKMLLNHIEEEAARRYPSLATRTFLSTTIAENAPMRRIFNLHGYVEHCLVDIVSLNPENIKTFKEKTSNNNGGDIIGTFSLQPCADVTQLTIALQNLRNTNRTKNKSSLLPVEWLPGEYLPWPTTSTQVMSFIKEKKIFLLSSNDNIEAVVFLGIGDHGSSFAGIVSASWPSLQAAIKHSLEVESNCTRLYIDRCGGAKIDKEYLENMFDVLRDYIVVCKPCQT